MGTILVIGATSAIGQSVIASAQAGQSFVVTARTKEQITHLQQQFPDVIQQGWPLDVTDHQAVLHVIEQALVYGPITGVVHLPGSIFLKPAHLTSFEEFEQVIRLNLSSCFSVIHAVAKLIKQDCHLVFFSTAAAHIGLAYHESIAAAKAGIEGLVRAAAATYAKNNLRMMVIAPGLIETPLSESVRRQERSRQYSLGLHTLGRFGQPDDISRLVHWLLQPENNWLSGQTWIVDGGLATMK